MTERAYTILVADDSADARLIMRAALRRAGYDVVLADGGLDALKKFDASPCDMVMLDVDMPDLGGYEVCAKLRAKAGPTLPIVMVTGLDDVASVEAAYDSGATDFIAKPVNWALIGHRVRYILRAAQALSDVVRGRERLSEAQRTAGIGSWEWHVATDAVEGSDEALRILNHGGESSGPMNFDDFFAVLDEADRQRLRTTLLQAGGSAAIEADYVVAAQADAVVRVVRICGRARQLRTGSLLVHGMVQDVTERRAAQDRIRHLAYHDSLTGLPNRAWLHERIAQALQQADREHGSLALMLLDLDDFKRINDTLGHSAGDQLLCGVALRLSQRLRRSDGLARSQSLSQPPAAALSRLGGDEFCIVAEVGNDADSVVGLAQRVLDAFAEPFTLAQRATIVTPSIGIALYPHDAADAESLMKAADMAMYHSKRKGPNGFSFFRRSMSERNLNRLTVESDLHRAIERDELVLHYQPIMADHGARIVGLEALVRWQHPEQGLIMPDRFIEVVEEVGMIVPLGTWVLRQACAQLAAWQAQGLHAPAVSVNVSGEQIGRDGFVQVLDEVLKRSGINPASLKLEITESALMRDADVALHNLQQAKARGVCVSIDDFGTGYSSLSYLKRFPVDEVKLDRSFVGEITQDPRSAAIASAVFELARKLALTVVAEGIENEQQAKLLWEMGCPRAQGYYFHRPRPVEAVTVLLQLEKAGTPTFNPVSASPPPLACLGQSHANAD